MRGAGVQKIIAGAAAAALLSSGGAQALLLHRCGSEVVMKSCCCEKGGQPGLQHQARFQEDRRDCCSIAPAPARREDAAPQAALSPHPSLVVSVVFAVLPVAPLEGDAGGFVLREAASAGPPILRTTCSLLI